MIPIESWKRRCWLSGLTAETDTQKSQGRRLQEKLPPLIEPAARSVPDADAHG